MLARRAALLLLPVMAWAQAPARQPAPEVEKALRARVTEFLQDFVDGQYRKALKFVAEESQDFYFASAKAEIKDFKIDEIRYDDAFQKAIVYFTTNREWNVQFENVGKVPVTVQMSTTWKVEDGQWAWYYRAEGEPWITAMGPSSAELVNKTPDAQVIMPKGFDQNAANSAADKILQQTKMDRTRISLLSDKASSDKASFHNAMNGSVAVELLDVPKIPGLTVKLDKTTLNFGQDAVIDVSYDPPADRDPDVPLQPRNFGVAVHPFEQIFWIQIEFQAPDKK